MLDFNKFTTAGLIRKKRNTMGNEIIQIEEGGWHFSFLGGHEKVLVKLNAYAHADFPEKLKDPQYLEELINRGLDLFDRDFKYKFTEIDDRFPNILRTHPDHFSHLVKPLQKVNATET